jgi:hypothetical protein
MSGQKKDKCLICGKSLNYATSPEQYKDLQCEFCKKSFNTNVFCEDGHYVCDSCHSKNAIQIIEDFCEITEIKDPFKLVNIIMQHPKFNMYGPEHHVLTSAVILTALRNNKIIKPNGEEISSFDIKEAIRRASKIPGGWCGFYGSCGAGMGSGVAISIFTGANPSTNYPRSLANEITSRSLAKIADNLEHCCKRSIRLSIIETLKFLEEKFNIKLEYKPEKCPFSELNDKCEKIHCPLF